MDGCVAKGEEGAKEGNTPVVEHHRHAGGSEGRFFLVRGAADDGKTEPIVKCDSLKHDLDEFRGVKWKG